jgi:hypothetical protein
MEIHPVKRRSVRDPARAVVIAAALAAALAACGGPQKPEPELTEAELSTANDPVVLAQRMVDAFAEMAVTAEAHVDDCPGMAVGLTEVFDRQRPLFDHVNEIAKDPDSERALSTAVRTYNAQATALADRMSAAVNRCRNDPAVGDAMARMPVLQ